MTSPSLNRRTNFGRPTWARGSSGLALRTAAVGGNLQYLSALNGIHASRLLPTAGRIAKPSRADDTSSDSPSIISPSENSTRMLAIVNHQALYKSIDPRDHEMPAPAHVPPASGGE